MSFRTQILVGLLAPAILAGVFVSLTRVVPSSRGGAWVAAVGTALAIAVGLLLVRGIPPFPPLEVEDWLPAIVLSAALAGASSSRPIIRLPFGLILVAATLGLLLRPMVVNAWETREAAAWVGGSLLLLMAVYVIVERGTGAASSPGRSSLAAWAIIAAAMAPSLMFGTSLVLARLAAALCLVIVVVAVCAPARIEPSPARTIGPIMLITGASLVLIGTVYASLPRASAVPLVVALGTPGLFAIGAVRCAGRLGLATVVLSATVLSAAGLAAAFAGRPAEVAETLDVEY